MSPVVQSSSPVQWSSPANTDTPPELSLNVKEEDVERIFQLLVECTDMFAQSQLMETLDAMAKVWHHIIFET